MTRKSAPIDLALGLVGASTPLLNRKRINLSLHPLLFVFREQLYLGHIKKKLLFEDLARAMVV